MGVNRQKNISIYIRNKFCQITCVKPNNDFDDIGHGGTSFTVSQCKKKCDNTPGCGAVSWNNGDCFMASSMAVTIEDANWICYARVISGKLNF